MARQWLYTKGDDVIEVEFHGIFQRAMAIEASPLVGGHKGGIISRPVAVISYDGNIKEVELDYLTYDDMSDEPDTKPTWKDYRDKYLTYNNPANVDLSHSGGIMGGVKDILSSEVPSIKGAFTHENKGS